MLTLREKARYVRMGFKEKASYLLQISSTEGEKLKVSDDSLLGINNGLVYNLDQTNTKKNTNFSNKDKELSSKTKAIQSEAIVDKVANSYINKLSQLIYFIKVLEKDVANKLSIDYDGIGDIISQLLVRLSRLFDIKMASILVEDTNNNFSSMATIGFSEKKGKKLILSKSNKLLYKFFNRGEATFIDDYQNSDEIVNCLSNNVSKVNFFLLLPMVVQDNFFGALNILSLKDTSVKKLSSKDIEVLSITSFILSSFLYKLIGYLPSTSGQKEKVNINNDFDVFMSTLDFMEKKMACFETTNTPVSIFIVTFTNIKQYLVRHKSYEYNKLVHKFTEECLTILDNPYNFHRFAINKFILVFEGIYGNAIKEKKNILLDSLKDTFGNTFIPGYEPYYIINTSFSHHNYDPYFLINYFNI